MSRTVLIGLAVGALLVIAAPVRAQSCWRCFSGHCTPTGGEGDEWRKFCVDCCGSCQLSGPICDPFPEGPKPSLASRTELQRLSTISASLIQLPDERLFLAFDSGRLVPVSKASNSELMIETCSGSLVTLAEFVAAEETARVAESLAREERARVLTEAFQR